jgi:hypothetical protein
MDKTATRVGGGITEAGDCLGVESSGAAVGLERIAGNRPHTVQHVVGERKEQSGLVCAAVTEDCVLAAQPHRNMLRTAPILPNIM